MKSIKIIHSLSNRARVQVSEMNFNLDVFEHLEKKMKLLTGILRVRSNPAISCMIFNFDSEKITQTSIVLELESHLEQWLSQNQPNKQLSMRSHKKDNNLLKPLMNFLSISIVGIGVLFRPLFTKKILLQMPGTPLGIITMISALPLLQNLTKDIKKRQISSETILDVSVYASIFAGEILAAIEILWITHASVLLQAWITERSRNAISSIVKISEKNVLVIKEGKEIEIPADKLKKDDIVRCYTGDKLPVDGHIIDGNAEIDESPITGRSEPIIKTQGNHVFAGSLVFQGEITVCAKKVGHHTYLSTIFQMVEDSLENKADIEGIAEKLSNRLIKLDLAITITTLLLTRDISRSFSVMLVMACPCATVLAASTAISSALYLAARNNILIKGGRYLEEMGKINIACFDKTGTLTTSEPVMTYLKNLSNMDDKKLLQFIYSAEKQSNHPIAIGFKNAAMKQGIKPLERESSNFIPGKGVHSVVQGNDILVGNQKLLEHFEINLENIQKELYPINQKSLSPVMVAINNELSGIAGFETLDRKNITKVVDSFHKEGVQKLFVITGDSKQTASELCKRYNFDDYYYSVLPEDKSKIIADIKSKGNLVLMVGDGINDSLALAEADIGVAMGAGGAKVAIEAADIALTNDNLQSLIFVRSLSHETLKVIYQNFWIAVGSDVLGVMMGALGFLSPLMAGTLHIFHTIGILGNSSRILIYSPQNTVDE